MSLASASATTRKKFNPNRIPTGLTPLADAVRQCVADRTQTRTPIPGEIPIPGFNDWRVVLAVKPGGGTVVELFQASGRLLQYQLTRVDAHALNEFWTKVFGCPAVRERLFFQSA